ncbi:MAG: 50S ribosomal protein L21 [Candidatus Harrisonbacteria bacterium RIFOXYD1_FULL_40_9]|uniref:Large ribosomal subunit protein bL21 n=1 Tax=Candidatus Harrisonbacteria bacterium RIFOXYD1_FULL_40_9 TaxID=1798412 RepID=A0A1G1ZYX5_9BACT|nr:MAG: 50S ribosomal protein L21 [Candidatus Harrisonbacteria bacterium RIFOXYD1_FULL_40_9]
MIAVIETGGKQYKVAPGQKIKVEKLDIKEGSSYVFDKVLLRVDGEDIKIGTPYVPQSRVEALVTRQGRHKKVIVFRYHSKNRFRKKKGHRQDFTEVEIQKIQ